MAQALRRKKIPQRDNRVPIVLLSVCALLFLFCTGDYNPFGDSSIAKAMIFTRLNNNDSLSIFSTETLNVKCSAVDKIKNFRVQVTKNRFFSDTTISYQQFDLSSLVSFNFLLSFYDTGLTTIKVTTLRKNGDIVDDSIRFYLYQPLKVRNTGEVPDSRIKLISVPVPDNKVIYHWKFEKLKEIKTGIAHIDTVIKSIPSAGKGTLWVTDLHENYASPSVPFTFSFSDTNQPVIECLNNVKNDTIFTSEKAFTFFANIYSASCSKFDAMINGELFTHQEGYLFTKEFTLVKNDLELHVTARSESGITSTKTFVVKYDPLISNSLRLEVNCPEASRGTVLVWGKVQQFYTPQFDIVIKAAVNGKFYAESQKFKATKETTWQFKLPLDTNNRDKKNLIEIAVYNTSDSLLRRDTTYVEYNKLYLDTLPPVIVDLSADYNTFKEDSLTVSSTNPRLRLIAFDGSGIKKVLVNETDITGKVTENFIWEHTVNVNHSDYRDFTVKVIDSLNDTTDTTVYILYNTPPQVISTFDTIKTILVDSLYTQRIEAYDYNRDLIQFEKITAIPENLKIGSDNGLISWTPAINDTGLYKIEIRIKDRYSYTTLRYSLYVSKKKEQPMKVISEKNFPSVIEANTALNMAIITDTLCGVAPFFFSGVTSNQKKLLFDKYTMKWTPDSTDTGLVQLTIIAKDQLTSAKIMPVIRVLPAFQKNSITCSWTGDTTANGSLDLRNTVIPDTLKITIADPSIRFRNFTASINYNAEKPYLIRIDSTGLYNFIIDKKRKNTGSDTLTITINDTLGNVVSYVKYLDYGVFRQPIITKPISNSVISDSAVTVSWNRCGDSGIVRYKVYIFQNESIVSEKNVSDTQVTVYPKENGLYYLRVVAVKYNEEIPSKALLFTYNYFKTITITTMDTIREFYTAGEDSLVISLIAENNRGRPSFTTCGENAALFSVDQNGTVIFKPTKEGVYSLSVAATDGAGYCDTFTITPILVIPGNRPCRLSSFPAIDELIDPVDSITYTFSITDPDTIIAEKYTTKVKMYNTESIKEIGPSRTFTVTVKASESYKPDDSLYVIVTDRGNFSDTIKAKLGKVKPPTIKYKYPIENDTVDVSNNLKFQWTELNIPANYEYCLQFLVYNSNDSLLDSIKSVRSPSNTFTYVHTETDLQAGYIIYFVNATRNGRDTIFGDTIRVTTIRPEIMSTGENDKKTFESMFKGAAHEILFKEE